MKSKWSFFLMGLCSILVSACNDPKDKTSHTKVNEAYPEDLSENIALLKQFPDSSNLRLKVANMLDSIGDYSNALIQMDSLIKRDSVNMDYMFTKGKIYQNAKDTSNAIKYFQKALNIYPAPETMLYLANLLAERKDPQAIFLVKNVKSMGRSKSDNANCDFIAGVYYARTNDSANAIKSLNLALEEDYTLMPAYIEKGLVYFDHHDYKNALEVFRFASQINHLYPDAYYYMGRSFEMMHIKDSAEIRFKQAYSLDKTFVEAQEGLKRLGVQ